MPSEVSSVLSDINDQVEEKPKVLKKAGRNVQKHQSRYANKSMQKPQEISKAELKKSKTNKVDENLEEVKSKTGSI